MMFLAIPIFTHLTQTYFLKLCNFLQQFFKYFMIISLRLQSVMVCLYVSLGEVFNPSLQFSINPLSTTGLLTTFLIGSYHETTTYLANHDKTKKMFHHKLSHETSFSDWFNTIFILTNRQVVLMGLKKPVLKFLEN